MGVGQSHGKHGYLHPLAGGQQGEAGQSLVQADRRVLVAFDPTFGEHHQLLASFEQVYGVAEAGQAGVALVDRETAQAL